MADERETISPEEFARWRTAPDTMAFLLGKYPERTAIRVMLDYWRDNEARIAAGKATFRRGRNIEATVERWVIPVSIWLPAYIGLDTAHLWATGNALIQPPYDSLAGDEFKPSISCLDIRFGGANNMAMPAAVEQRLTVTPTIVPHAGGAPRKDYWEDMWVEMVCRMYESGLSFTKQADLVRIMTEWLEEQGHDPSESAVKTRARKLFEALQKVDKN